MRREIERIRQGEKQREISFFKWPSSKQNWKLKIF